MSNKSIHPFTFIFTRLLVLTYSLASICFFASTCSLTPTCSPTLIRSLALTQHRQRLRNRHHPYPRQRPQATPPLGNLDDTPDNADAATIEDFYRNRRLFQLSAAGEAAEQALATFDEYIHRPGEIQTTALRDIISFLEALYPLLAGQPPDDTKLHQLLTSLVSRFEQLTTRAQSFMRGLHSTIELHGISVDAFLAYKQRLIDYLENFISELVSSTGKIAATLAHLERCGLAAIAFPAAAHHETADLLDPAPDAREHALTRATARWNQRWDGIRRWFIPTGGSPSQSEHLRARARSAIPALLNAVTQINDRRSSRADRAADFSTLARWFAQAPPATRRATASGTPLSPSPPPITCASTTKPSPPAPRKTTPPRTGWLQAAPVWLSPRLRQYGQNAPRGTSHPVIDRSAEKQRLLEIAREQTAQIEQARLRLIHAGRVRLSELAPPHTPLADHPFRLLLELLGHALSQRPDRAGPIDVESTDGTLRIPLEPLPAATATLATHDGNFTGRDHWLTITHAHPATAHSAAPRRA